MELSSELRRQIGVLINRQGSVAQVIVGDEKGLLIPELKDYPLGRKRLRGLRLIHTHLKGEPLSEDDLTDLKLLRLDLVAALSAHPGSSQLTIHLAHIADSSSGIIIYPPQPFERFTGYGSNGIVAIERELERVVDTAAHAASGQERAILISVMAAGERREAEDSLDELAELARTAGVLVLDRFIQLPRKLNPRTLMGEGKLQEVVIRALQRGATLLIFDQELTPAQVRTISSMTELKVIDRSQLILDIFARRAPALTARYRWNWPSLNICCHALPAEGCRCPG